MTQPEIEEEIYTPSYHEEKCRHNGDTSEYEIACDECDYAQICMPDWEYLANNRIGDDI